jgi:hypothetical protein
MHVIGILGNRGSVIGAKWMVGNVPVNGVMAHICGDDVLGRVRIMLYGPIATALRSGRIA